MNSIELNISITQNAQHKNKNAFSIQSVIEIKVFQYHILTDEMHPHFLERGFQILLGQRPASHQVGKHAEHSTTFPVNHLHQI